MSSNKYDDLSTPQLHAENERNRRKYHRADAASRNADPWGQTFTATGLDGPKEYWQNKKGVRGQRYAESQQALEKRGEPETEYTLGNELKDSFIGANKPLHRPMGKKTCTVM